MRNSQQNWEEGESLQEIHRRYGYSYMELWRREHYHESYGKKVSDGTESRFD
jgi:hypothetical protein